MAAPRVVGDKWVNNRSTGPDRTRAQENRFRLVTWGLRVEQKAREPGRSTCNPTLKVFAGARTGAQRLQKRIAPTETAQT